MRYRRGVRLQEAHQHEHNTVELLVYCLPQQGFQVAQRLQTLLQLPPFYIAFFRACEETFQGIGGSKQRTFLHQLSNCGLPLLDWLLPAG